MSSNFVLIGMPACGKSTLGVVAAKMLCMDFFDVDLFLQKRLGASLQSYIEKFGTSAFLEAEADAICALELENTIISTGGSAVLTERGAKRLCELGKMVYIKAPLPIIEARIGDLDRRGVTHEAGQTVRDIYEERTPIYEKYADATIEVGKTEIAETSRALADLLERLKNEK